MSSSSWFREAKAAVALCRYLDARNLFWPPGGILGAAVRQLIAQDPEGAAELRRLLDSYVQNSERHADGERRARPDRRRRTDQGREQDARAASAGNLVR